MGARYLKAEEEEIVNHYPSASPAEMFERIPNRTWPQIGVHARRMRVLRTTTAWGNSIREGQKKLIPSWSDADNDKFDRYYPHSTREALLKFFYSRTWLSIRPHAQKRHIHRTREAVGREIRIGRENARKEQ